MIISNVFQFLIHFRPNESKMIDLIYSCLKNSAIAIFIKNRLKNIQKDLHIKMKKNCLGGYWSMKMRLL